MRDAICLYINGERHEFGAEYAFQPLSDILRYILQQTGTKVVCAEGDCGACSVLMGRVSGGTIDYVPINACIQYLYQVDATHIVTIEGMKDDNELNKVQQAMATCHGAQCGYCTPGIVVTMCDFFTKKDDNAPATQQDIKDCLSGNLCRCTGYEPIIKAGVSESLAGGLSLPILTPDKAMLDDLANIASQSLHITHNNRDVFNPATLDEALAHKNQHPDAVIIAGGTDVSVFCNKRDFKPQKILNLCLIDGLSDIETSENNGQKIMTVGAKASLAQLETTVKDSIPELHKILSWFGGPQIKHAGTLAGNIANGSPIADSTPFLMVMDAEVEVQSTTGGSRRINLNALYTGYKEMSLLENELITKVHIPLPAANEKLRLYKVSKRTHLDISTFTAAIIFSVENDTVQNARVAYGGVGPVVYRLHDVEDALNGKPYTEDTFRAAGKIARNEIAPISDVRGDKTYRLQLAENILLKCYFETLQNTHEVPA